MRENALQALETDEQTEKGAQSKAFEFAVAGDVVRVTSGSHQHPDEYTYMVQRGNTILDFDALIERDEAIYRTDVSEVIPAEAAA